MDKCCPGLRNLAIYIYVLLVSSALPFIYLFGTTFAFFAVRPREDVMNKIFTLSNGSKCTGII